jgi:hypothetical protein
MPLSMGDTLGSVTDILKKVPEDVQAFVFTTMDQDNTYRHEFNRVMSSGSEEQKRVALEDDKTRITSPEKIRKKYAGVYTDDEIEALIMTGMWATR